MTDIEALSKRFCELNGIKPKRIIGLNMYSQEVDRLEYPNFTDAREVLKVMMKREEAGRLQAALFAHQWEIDVEGGKERDE